MGRLCISRDMVFLRLSLNMPLMSDMEIYWYFLNISG